MAYRSSGNTGNDANSTTKTVNLSGLGLQVDDTVTAILTRWTNNNAPTIPTGFTQRGTTMLSSDGQANVRVYTKRITVAGDATDEPDGNYQFSWASGSNDWSHLHIIVHSGRASGNPVEDIQFWNAASAGNFGSITVNASTGADLIWTAYNDSAGTHTPPSTFTERIDFDSGSSATKDNVGAGSQSVTSPNAGSVTSSSPAAAVLISLKAAGGGSVSGTASAPLGALAASASGVPTVGASASAPFGGLAAAASGTRKTSGTASAPLGALAAAATGRVIVSGVAAAPLGGLSAAASGTPKVVGSAIAPLGALTASASGSGIGSGSGSAAAPLGPLTVTATATVAVPGTAAAPLGGLTAAASGAVRVTASATATFGGLSATAAGSVLIPGPAAAPLGPLAAAATGTSIGSGAGIASAPLGSLAAGAIGVRATRATAVAAFGALIAGMRDESAPPTIGGNGLQVEEITAKCVSFVQQLAEVESVNDGDIRHMASGGLRAALFFSDMLPIPVVSGMGAVSVRLEYKIRLYGRLQSEPSDAVDPEMTRAVDAICNAFASQFTLEGVVRNVDVLGANGEAMRARSGYLDIEAQTCRVVDITIPLICNDVWILED